MIICAVVELHGQDWNEFKRNWVGSIDEVYQAYEAFHNCHESDTSQVAFNNCIGSNASDFENTLWDWYCELTGR